MAIPIGSLGGTVLRMGQTATRCRQIITICAIDRAQFLVATLQTAMKLTLKMSHWATPLPEGVRHAFDYAILVHYWNKERSGRAISAGRKTWSASSLWKLKSKDAVRRAPKRGSFAPSPTMGPSVGHVGNVITRHLSVSQARRTAERGLGRPWMRAM